MLPGDGPCLQGLHAVDEHVLHAGGKLVRLESGATFGELLSVKDHQVGARASAHNAAIAQPQQRRRASAEAVDGLRRAERPALSDHEAEIPCRPRISAVKESVGERAVRREGGGVRARYAQRMTEAHRLLVFLVAVNDGHHRGKVVSTAAQQIVGRVEGVLTTLRRNVAQAAAGTAATLGCPATPPASNRCRR